MTPAAPAPRVGRFGRIRIAPDRRNRAVPVFLVCAALAALARVVAWVGMRLEINVAECAILGMVGAGGVGFVIANGIQNYEYGTAGVAILLVFALAYATERLFVCLKRRLR